MNNILLIHNYYQQSGGEDEVFSAEKRLLENHGHRVITYADYNSRSVSMSNLRLFLNSIWSNESFRHIRQLIRETKPDVVHIHNTFFMISPSVYFACKKERVPVVQTLLNPRLICPGASLSLGGSVCEKCIDSKFPWLGVRNKCYHNSSLQTFTVAFTTWFHKLIGTWHHFIDSYIVATRFYSNEFKKSSFSSIPIEINPHFIDPDPEVRQNDDGDYGLFIGRLDREKGIFVLLDALKRTPNIKFIIRGGGNNLEFAKDFLKVHDLEKNVTFVDKISKEELFQLIKKARFLVMPSLGYYETFGLVAVEAFACGVPVIASRAGVLEEIVKNDVTGLHFISGDGVDLAEKIHWAWEHPGEMSLMGRNARAEYEAKYTADKNYEQLMNIYQIAIKRNKSRGNAKSHAGFFARFQPHRN